MSILTATQQHQKTECINSLKTKDVKKLEISWMPRVKYKKA